MFGEPSAWRIAAALAHACALDWGRWAAGETAEPSPGCRGCWERSRLDGPGRRPCDTHLRPVPDPSDVEAYLADCRRRQVEPGIKPSLSWSSEQIAWYVAPDARYLRLCVGLIRSVATLSSPDDWYIGGLVNTCTKDVLEHARIVGAVDAVRRAA